LFFPVFSTVSIKPSDTRHHVYHCVVQVLDPSPWWLNRALNTVNELQKHNHKQQNSWLKLHQMKHFVTETSKTSGKLMWDGNSANSFQRCAELVRMEQVLTFTCKGFLHLQQVLQFPHTMSLITL
jgi:hypothetical protein